MERSVQFGSRSIDFHLEFKDRKTLGIAVNPDRKVRVYAPVGTSLEKINEKILKKAPWIIKQQSFFLSFEPKTPPRRFVAGETHLYMGRQYVLKIEINEQDSVKLKGKYLVVGTLDRSKVKNLIKGWYHKHAETKFLEIAKPLIKQFNKHNVEPSGVILRNMPTRWGSCTTKGKIILNPELIKAPRACIEYVIVHELCHLIHHDHTRQFIELQTREMPDWEKWKEKLETLLA